MPKTKVKLIVNKPVPANTHSAPRAEEWTGLITAGFILLAFLVYFKSLQGFFIYGDDEHMIVKNIYLTRWSFLPRLFLGNIKEGFGQITNHWRPLQMMIYFVVAQAVGLKPWAFHFINVLLQGANGVLLWLLLRRIFPETGLWIAAAAAALWMNHPIHVEDVAMINGTATPLHAAWILGASLSFLNVLGQKEGPFWFSPGRIRWYLLSLGCFAAGLASKESAIVAPALLLALHLTQERLRQHGQALSLRQWLMIHGPFWAMAAFYVTLRLTALNFGGTLNFYDKPTVFTENFLYRVYTLITVLAFSFKILLVPMGLHPERQWPVYAAFFNPVVLGSLALLLAVVAAAICFRRREPRITLGIFWFFASYAPMSNLFAKINSLFWEHWLYVPSLGLVIAALAVLSHWQAIRRALAPGAFAAAIFFGAISFGRSAHWMDSVSYFRYVLRHEPHLAKAWNNLAMAVSDRRLYREAVEYYRKAVQLDDSYAETHHNLGNVYLNLNLIPEAQTEFRRAISMNPRFYHSYISLASIDLARGNAGQAILYLDAALAIHPHIPGLADLVKRLRSQGAR
ncbi:MAG: tetratricopeptide repeat protein [Elusimicrobia bacterium]|nr:tetratricopeptide repeat protein [Elusimicrobiota bacterium]